MARRVADVLQIVVLAAGAHAALARGRAHVVAPLLAEKHILELHHAGIGEQQRRIIARHQRGRRHDACARARGSTRERRGARAPRSCRAVGQSCCISGVRRVSPSQIVSSRGPIAPDSRADMIDGKAPILQKTRLPCLLAASRSAAATRSGGCAPRAPALPSRPAPRHGPASAASTSAASRPELDEIAPDAQRSLTALGVSGYELRARSARHPRSAARTDPRAPPAPPRRLKPSPRAARPAPRCRNRGATAAARRPPARQSRSPACPSGAGALGCLFLSTFGQRQQLRAHLLLDIARQSPGAAADTGECCPCPGRCARRCSCTRRRPSR